MNKLLLILIFSFLPLLANQTNNTSTNQTNFSPSFDCKKASTKVELAVCSKDEFMGYDLALNALYQGIYKVDKDIKKSQIEWIKEQRIFYDLHTSENREHFVGVTYIDRISDLNSEYKSAVSNKSKELLKTNPKLFTKNILQIQKDAKEYFEKEDSVLQPIIMFEASGIEHLIDNKPDTLTNEEYSLLLYDYAYYKTLRVNTRIYETDRIYWYYLYASHVAVWIWDVNRWNDLTPLDDKYLQLANKALNSAAKATPNDARLYKLLGENYYKLYIFAQITIQVARHYDLTNPPYNEIAPYIKNAYMKYVELCKEQGIKSELNEIEQTIVNRQGGIFIELFSTFNGASHIAKVPYLGEEFLKYRLNNPEYKDICKEYVAMLNLMPDNNLTECSRYVNSDNSKFEFVKDEDTPEQWKRYGAPDSIFIHKYSFLVKYKDKYFIDKNFDSLVIAGGEYHRVFRQNREYDVCQYDYVYFSKEKYRTFVDDQCSSISNYDEIYKNIKE